MNKFLLVVVLGFIWVECLGGKPEIPNDDLFPFMVYYESRTRGLCVGSLVSRVVVLTAAVCVADPYGRLEDPRPINVVTGTRYRHTWRGIRVQVKKILMPKLPDDLKARDFMIQRAIALLLLNRKVPDILTEQPLRAIDIDNAGDEKLALKEKCVIIGWHFFYTQDKILPSNWFMLHRHMRYQHLNIVDTETYCGPLLQQYEKTAQGLRPEANYTRNDVICLQDGMYGAPVVCGAGRVAGLLAAPRAQPPRCTGHTVVAHRLPNYVNTKFLQCVKTLFDPEYYFKWEQIKNDSNSDC